MVLYVTKWYISYFRVYVWQLLTINALNQSVNIVNLWGYYLNKFSSLVWSLTFLI